LKSVAALGGACWPITHLSSVTGEQANARIDALMARFTLDWSGVR